MCLATWSMVPSLLSGATHWVSRRLCRAASSVRVRETVALELSRINASLQLLREELDGLDGGGVDGNPHTRCVSAHVCISACLHVHVCVSARVRVCMCAYLCMPACACLGAFLCVHVCVCICVCMQGWEACLMQLGCYLNPTGGTA